MVIEVVVKLVVTCDGGGCGEQIVKRATVNETDALSQSSELLLEVIAEGWKSRAGCIYCPKCNKRISG